MKAKGRNTKQTARSRVSPQAWRMIRREAKDLRISPDEYIRLTGSLFSTLRKTLVKQRAVNGKGLLSLVENPLFGVVIQYIAENAQSVGKLAAPGEPATSEAPTVAGNGGTSAHRPPPMTPYANQAPQPLPHPQAAPPQPANIPPEWQFF